MCAILAFCIPLDFIPDEKYEKQNKTHWILFDIFFYLSWLEDVYREIFVILGLIVFLSLAAVFFF